MEPQARNLADVWEWELEDEALDHRAVVAAACACWAGSPRPILLQSPPTD